MQAGHLGSRTHLLTDVPTKRAVVCSVSFEWDVTGFLLTYLFLAIFQTMGMQFSPSQSPARSMPYGLREKQDVWIFFFFFFNGAFRLSSSLSLRACCLTDASNNRKGRAAVWACLWLSVKQWTVSPTSQTLKCHWADPGLIDKVLCLHAHPEPPAGPLREGHSAADLCAVDSLRWFLQWPCLTFASF